jgi:opacity protein-like surface antigen
MRRLILATAAAAAITATPAVARDGSGYIGLEGGVLFPRDSQINVDTDPTDDEDLFDTGIDVDYKTGYDVDLIGGYDFGMFRLEGELGYKRAKADELDLDDDLQDVIEDDLGRPLTDAELDLDGRVRVWSGMLNGLVDIGGDSGFGAYAGLGVGVAGVKADFAGGSDSDSGLAWQLIAGVRTAISDNIDAGLKYRYFRTKRLNFNDDLDFDGDAFDVGARTRFSSHSLLASLTYNFGAAAAAPPPPPPPPPPPAPVAPATQTCPDGSVILATSACPLPPPPPPPPPVERGERGR